MSGEKNLDDLIVKDEGERKRLDEGYLFFKKHTRNNRVIFNESVILPEDATILDVATGAGSWILDVTQTVPPSVSIYGIDISPAYFPMICSPNNPNIFLSEYSCTSLPEDWTNRFDFVNQSILAGSLTEGDWVADIRELYRVTKPGGHIQLYEPSNASWDCPPGSANDKMKSILKALLEKHSLIFDAEEKISRMLLDVGFVDVGEHKDTYPVNANKDESGKHGADLVIRLLRRLQPSILPLGIVNAEEYENLMAELQREWDNGLPYKYYVTVWGRKPLQYSV